MSAPVYFSLDLVLSDDLAQRQKEICTAFKLQPRTELHLTLGFLGELTEPQVAQITAAFRAAKLSVPRSMKVLGLGGAARENETSPILAFTRARLVDEKLQRVAWLAIEPSPELLTLRDELWKALGRTAPPGKFWPHVTLGSAGPPLFDVHQIDKGASETDQRTLTLTVKKLHLTDIGRHPASIAERLPAP